MQGGLNGRPGCWVWWNGEDARLLVKVRTTASSMCRWCEYLNNQWEIKSGGCVSCLGGE